MPIEEGHELKIGIGVGFTGTEMEKLNQTMNNINNSTSQVATGFKTIEQALSKLNSTQDKTKGGTSALDKEYRQLRNNVNNLMNDMKSGHTSTTATIKKLRDEYAKLDKMLANANRKGQTDRAARIKAVQAQIISSIDQSERRITQIKKAGLNERKALHDTSIAKELRLEQEKVQKLKSIWQQEVNNYNLVQKQLNAKSSLKDFSSGGSTFKDSILYAGWQLAGIRTLTAEFQNLGREIIEIDYQLVNTQRIMQDFSDSTADYLLNNAVEIAKATNTQITDAQKIQSAWVRINDEYAKSPELLNKISEATAKFMNVGEIEDAEEAVKLVNATMLQFELDVDEGIETLNKWAYMADKTAMGTADEYGEAMSKIGGYIKSINGEVDDAIVLTSILGDRLAKNGDEAGNSLKTITAYLTRTKTMNLFDEITEQTQNFDFSLRNANGTFKDFNGLMDAASQAYNYFISQGTQAGDEMAKKIQEALGATRQGDVALTLLQNWGEESQKYYAMINESVAGEQSYLDQQNEALMETFSAQWNELRVSIQEFGMAIARSGVLDFLGGLMDALGGALNVISDLPEPIMRTATAFGMLKVIQAASTYIGKLTGLTEKYNILINQGTASEIENANAISASANAYMVRMDALAKNNQLSENAIHAYINQKAMLAELNAAYNEGAITASQYSQAVRNLIGDKQLSSNATRMDTEALLRNANETQKHIRMKGQQAVAWKASTNATNQNTVATNQNDVSNKKLNLSLVALNYQKAKELMSSKQGTIATNAKSAANLREGVSATVAAGGNELLAKALAKVGAAAGIVTGFLGKVIQFISPILAIVSIISVLNSLGQSLFGLDDNENIKSYDDTIQALEESLSQGKERLQELKNELAQSGSNQAIKDAIAKQKEYNEQLENSIKLQKQSKYYDEYFGDNGDEDNKSEQINTNIETLENYDSKIAELNKRIDGYQDKIVNLSKEPFLTDRQQNELLVAQAGITETNKKIEELTRDARDAASSLVVSENEIQDLFDQGLINEADYEKFNLLLSDIKQLDGIIKNFTVDNNGIMQTTQTFSELVEKLDKYKEKSDALQDSMDSIFDNSLTNDELVKLIGDYEGFYKVANGGAQEQIRFLRELQEEQKNLAMGDVITQYTDLFNEYQQLQEQLEDYNNGVITLDSEEVEQAKIRMQELETEMGKVQAIGEIYLNARIELPDLGDVTSQMEGLVSATNDLVEAQNKLAQGTALSKKELYDLAMTYPELLYQADLFNTTTVSGQQEAINAVLQMKQDEFNGKIDLQIQELEAQKEFIQGVLEQEQSKQEIIAKAEVDQANGRLETEAQVQEMLGKYNDAIGEQYTLAEQYKIDKAVEAGEARVDAENQTGQKTVDSANSAGEGIADAITEGAAAGVDGANKNSTLLGNIFERIRGWASNLATWVAKAFSGDKSGGGAVSGGSGGGDRSSTFRKASYDEVDKTINGMSVSDWIATQKEALALNVESYKVQLGQLNNAITNLEHLKNQGLTGVSNNYSSSGAGGGTGDKSSGGKSDAEKAIEDAMEAIEKLANQYIKNVESMQDRIAKALKKKYQEQYDERKKLLEKEHNDRVAQIQSEIDAINGNRPQDKQSELERLQDKLKQWQQDDSTLGKARQKEYIDQIAELQKEIKLDELEKQLDEENESYKNSIDSESEFYDAILKKLDLQMTDEYLYKEANYLIANNKQQEIVDLLTEFDAQWDGWATLMGETAGEIIAKEVALAMANYKDVMDGTITENGGTNTNKITGVSSSSTSSGSTSSGSSGGSSSSSTRYHTIASGDTLWDLAQKYYGDGSKWTKIQNANGGINPYTLTIGKKIVIPFASGGYTGMDEGLAFLHQKERVLNAQQTSAFDTLVYDFMPTVKDWLVGGSSNTFNNGGNVTFNKPLVSVNIDKLNQNKEFDVNNGIDNLGRMIENSLKKSGINLKK